MQKVNNTNATKIAGRNLETRVWRRSRMLLCVGGSEARPT